MRKMGLFLLALFLIFPASARSRFDFHVDPFYDSRGPVLNVGPYSAGLASADPNEVRATVARMRAEFAELPVEAMYAAAIRLYDIGDRDAAVYWYYAAQYRGRWFARVVMHKEMIGDAGFELRQAHAAFQELAGVEINGYAGCDARKWADALRRVREDHQQTPPAFDRAYPRLAFANEEAIRSAGDAVSHGLSLLEAHVRENETALKVQRAASGADSRFCAPKLP